MSDHNAMRANLTIAILMVLSVSVTAQADTVIFGRGQSGDYAPDKTDMVGLKFGAFQEDIFNNTDDCLLAAGEYDDYCGVVLIGFADLFELIPPESLGPDVEIESASLELLIESYGANYDGSATWTLSRMTTNWLTGDAGTNQNNVSHDSPNLAGSGSGQSTIVPEWTTNPNGTTGDYPWGAFGQLTPPSFGDNDYTSENAVSTPAQAVGLYTVFDVTQLLNDAYLTGENYGLILQTDNPDYVMIHAAANMTGDYRSPAYDMKLTITYNSSSSLTVESGSGDGEYDEGEVIAIIADAAATGRQFDGWVGDVSGVDDVTAPSTTVTIPPAHVTVTATYGPMTFDGDLNGDGKVDIVDMNMVLIDWNKSMPDLADPNSDADGSGTVDLTDLNTVLIDWNKAAVFMLTVNSGSGDGLHDAGSTVAISADAPPIGIEFSGWIGDIAGVADVDQIDTTITMTSDAAITATYSYIEYTLTVTSGTGDGTYTYQKIVNITADTAPTDYAFEAWIGDTGGVASTTSPSTTLTMPDASQTVTATYAIISYYSLTVTSGSGDGSYTENQIVNITADASLTNDYAFNEWVGDTGNIANTRSPSTTLTMPTTSQSITATYAQGIVYTLTITGGSGSGNYLQGQTVNIVADAAPTGEEFNMWIGDAGNWVDGEAYIGSGDEAGVTTASTTYTMPAGDAVIAASYKPTGMPTDHYQPFERLAGEIWGAEKDPLVYQYAGDTLVFEADGQWSYPSETSAFVAFETNLPAISYLEYGTDTSYGSTITHDASFFFLHQYHITGLANNTTYHYRLVIEDERGNQVVGTDHTLATATPAGVTYISGGTFSSRQIISTGGYYLLTGDIYADGTAFEITTSNVTLDLGGHTITYNIVDYPIDVHATKSTAWGLGAPGIKAYNRGNVKIVNGIIKQGIGASVGQKNGYGASPIWFRGYSSSGPYKVAGVTADYSSQVNGMLVPRGEVHHCTTIDRGNVILNRHSGVKAIEEAPSVNHTLIARTRHVGISPPGDSEFYDNEIYVDSWAANSYAIRGYDVDNMQAYGNRVFGTGYSVIGIAAVSDSINCDINDNLFQMYGFQPSRRDREYGKKATLGGLNMRWHGSGLRHDNNVVSVKLTEGSNGNAVFICTYNQYVEVGGTIEVGDKFILTISDNDAARSNPQSITVVASSTSASAVASQIVSAVNGSSLSHFQKLNAWADGTRAVLDEAVENSALYMRTVTTESDGSAADDQTVLTKIYNTISFTNNIFKLEALDNISSADGAVDITGAASETTGPFALFTDNTVISNICNVMLAEDYGSGHNAKFVGNTFTKIGSRSDYRTIRGGYWYWDTLGHEFFDSIFTGGASYSSYAFIGTGTHEFYVGWTLTVDTKLGATVTINDSTGTEVYSGVADANGICQAQLYQYRQRDTSQTYYTAHTVYVSEGSNNDSTTVTMDAKKTVYLPLP